MQLRTHFLHLCCHLAHTTCRRFMCTNFQIVIILSAFPTRNYTRIRTMVTFDEFIAAATRLIVSSRNSVTRRDAFSYFGWRLSGRQTGRTRGGFISTALEVVIPVLANVGTEYIIITQVSRTNHVHVASPTRLVGAVSHAQTCGHTGAVVGLHTAGGGPVDALFSSVVVHLARVAFVTGYQSSMDTLDKFVATITRLVDAGWQSFASFLIGTLACDVAQWWANFAWSFDGITGRGSCGQNMNLYWLEPLRTYQESAYNMSS